MIHWICAYCYKKIWANSQNFNTLSLQPAWVLNSTIVLLTARKNMKKNTRGHFTWLFPSWHSPHWAISMTLMILDSLHLYRLNPLTGSGLSCCVLYLPEKLNPSFCLLVHSLCCTPGCLREIAEVSPVSLHATVLGSFSWSSQRAWSGSGTVDMYVCDIGLYK